MVLLSLFRSLIDPTELGRLIQILVFSLCFQEYRQLGVSVFPGVKESFVGLTALGLFADEGEGTGLPEV
ncbi:hypothetical protein BH10ACI2_BH10ACI2_11860 [soil metagenome]